VLCSAVLVLTSLTTIDYKNDFHHTALPLMLMGCSCISTQIALIVFGYVRPVTDKQECERSLNHMVPIANFIQAILVNFPIGVESGCIIR
jgi:hypothetical protein